MDAQGQAAVNRVAYIFVPGVLNYPGSAREWTDQAVTWIHRRMTCEAAEKFEYLALPFSRKLLARHRAQALADLIDQYPLDLFSLVLAGHSNGCDVIRLALAVSKRPANWVHFFSPAVPAAPAEHRLKALVRAGRIGFLNLYLAGRDGVLGRAHLGGLPAEAVRRQFADEPHTKVFSEDFGHSGWFSKENFETTMRRVGGLADKGIPL